MIGQFNHGLFDRRRYESKRPVHTHSGFWLMGPNLVRPVAVCSHIVIFATNLFNEQLCFICTIRRSNEVGHIFCGPFRQFLVANSVSSYILYERRTAFHSVIYCHHLAWYKFWTYVQWHGIVNGLLGAERSLVWRDIHSAIRSLVVRRCLQHWFCALVSTHVES